MTSARATSEERDPDRLRHDDFPHHPTLVEIAQRQREIEAWQALSVGGYRFAKPCTIIAFLVTAVAVFLTVTPVPPNWPWNVPMSILAIFSAVAMVVCGLLWLDKPDIGPRPELLQVVPFSRAENLYLMSKQAVESYYASCVCPGCGDESTHVLRVPDKSEPEWATVTRHCRTCDREWVQS
jgi:hypothetical protein